MYDYKEAIKDDIKDYIESEEIEITPENRDEMIEVLNDDLWVNDSVTGNASGSYTFNSYEAMENLFGNEDLLEEVDREFGIDEDRKWDWEYLDVSIRCYLLYECIVEVIDEYIEELEDEDEQDF